MSGNQEITDLVLMLHADLKKIDPNNNLLGLIKINNQNTNFEIEKNFHPKYFKDNDLSCLEGYIRYSLDILLATKKYLKTPKNL